MKRTKLTKICPTCTKEFTTFNDSKEANFCSIQCFNISPKKLASNKFNFKGDAWNRGLTKETDERVAKYANTQSVSRTGISDVVRYGEEKAKLKVERMSKTLSEHVKGLSEEEFKKWIHLDKKKIKKNGKERIIEVILNRLFPNEYKFTGDFSFTIDHYSPDFTNVNGQKKLIEHFGKYWHASPNKYKSTDLIKFPRGVALTA